MRSVRTRVSVAVALAFIGGLSFTSNAQQGQPAPRPPDGVQPLPTDLFTSKNFYLDGSTGWIAAIPAATRRGS